MPALASQFDYVLPSELIAQYPHYTRGASRLLVLDKTNNLLVDDLYGNLFNYLQAGDVLVLNDTKVIKARLIAKKNNGVPRELLLLEKHGCQDNWHKHTVVYRGQIKKGEILTIGEFQIEVLQINLDGTAIIQSQKDLLDLAKEHGSVPLPPYIKRQANKSDDQTYQTVWAKNTGSVAAPTASLNMTKLAIKKLQQKGIKIYYLTLHVGLGTFMPIRSTDLSQHKMHHEYFEIPQATVAAIQQAKTGGNRVVAVGTTVARTLEYCAADILKEPPKNLCGEADIFVYPGYQFKIVDVLLTNFHAPRSTVLMMAGAFAGWDTLMKTYEHAKQNGYWFLSYGDSMLII
jgi:S-adenosylmethionine:tRNA ribosyltransferase-isomerase